MGFNFNKKSKYSRFEVHKIVTGKDDGPSFDMGRTGYGRIGNDLFIFMNIGVPGRDGLDYKNYYDERTEAVSWCAKRDTHSDQPLMQKIINGDLNLYLFARWDIEENDWTYLGKGHVISFEDNVAVADKDGKDAICMEYQLTCRGIEEDITDNEIELGKLILKDTKPRKKIKKKTKRTFKGKKNRDYLLKAATDKKTGDLGELLVLEYEKNRLINEGKKELSHSVEHISQTEGDGAGYDIKSFSNDGKVKYIEVKTTKSNLSTDFFMTPSELDFSKLHANNYFLYRVYDLKIKPLSGSLYIYNGNILDSFDKEATEFKMIYKGSD
tara:strand:+ start:824 stop:1798 length:975 start_codon:yes stop_codon:yes gene_type:complete